MGNRSRLPNKRMQLTKLRAAPERQRKVPPCARAASVDAGTASQLIRSVRQLLERTKMGRSPEAVFGEAQDAKARGDLAAFFRCLDRKDQLRLGASAMLGLLGEEPRVVAVFSTLRDQHGIASVAADELRSLTGELAASAQAIPSLQGVARESASSDHAVLVKRHERAVKELLESVSDLPRLLGDVEPAFRQLFGGSLVSSSLLVGDSLEQVTVQGNRAWGTRVSTTSTGSRRTEDIGFVRDRSGEWRIRLLARRPPSLEKKG